MHQEGQFDAEDNWLVDDQWRLATLDEALTSRQAVFDLDYREVRLRSG